MPTNAAIGSQITGGGKCPTADACDRALPLVAIFMTTSTEEVPGVTGVGGLKVH
jgi:hypothetical protein